METGCGRSVFELTPSWSSPSVRVDAKRDWGWRVWGEVEESGHFAVRVWPEAIPIQEMPSKWVSLYAAEHENETGSAV